jgi:hypothetical protein
MLRIGKNPKDPGEAQVSAEKQEELAEPIEIETGMPIQVAGAKYMAGDQAARARALEYEEVVVLSIPRKEFERLNIKTNEVLAEAALAQERIGKDQQEIEELKRETRAMLTQLRAA